MLKIAGGKDYIRWSFIYLALVSFGLAQPLFNDVGIFIHETSIDLSGIILIAVFFQFVVTGVLVLVRFSLGRFGRYFDMLVFAAVLLSLLRQVQQTYLQTEGMSVPAKYILASVMVIIVIATIKYLKKMMFQFAAFLGMISPVFFVYFIYTMAYLPLTWPSQTRLPQTTDDKSKPPVILLVLDELSLPLLLSNDGNIDPDRFPNIHAFSKNSLWFRQAMTNTPSTTSSFPSFMTGNYDFQDRNKIKKNIERLPHDSIPFAFKSHGYNVSFISNHFGCAGKMFSCPKYYGGGGTTLLWRVFKKFIHTFGPDFLVDSVLPWIKGERLQYEVEQLIKIGHTARSGDFYLVHLMMSHAPYVFNREGGYLFSPHLRMSAGTNFKEALVNYTEQLRYLDKNLGYFFKAAKESGVLDRAIIAIVADHGNCWTNECPGRVYPEQIKTIMQTLPRVPVMFHAPKIKPRIDDGDFQLIDLFPTLMEIAGLPLGSNVKTVGRSALTKPAYPRNRLFFLFSNVTPDKAIDIGLPVKNETPVPERR